MKDHRLGMYCGSFAAGWAVDAYSRVLWHDGHPWQALILVGACLWGLRSYWLFEVDRARAPRGVTPAQ